MKRWILLISLLFVALPGLASEGEENKEGAEAGAAVPRVVYVSLSPALVGNYGSGPAIQYYKADIALQVTGEDNAARVSYHEPLIRNQLIMLFARQTDQSLATPEARETLRQAALKQVQEALDQEEGKPLVDDLLFNNLVVQ